jgi:hypothetical protein
LIERFNGSVRDECLNLETFHNRDHARALCKLYAQQYNEHRPHSSLGYLTPLEFAGQYTRDGCAGGQGLRLTPLTPPAGNPDNDGPTASSDRPASRQAIHDGAPVARQQSRVLRVDQMSLSTTKGVGKVPTKIR